MKNFSKDFDKYLSGFVNKDYKNKYYKSIKSMHMDYENPSSNPFDRLLQNRVIILSGEMDDYLCEIIKANLLYLESIDREKDISIYINSGGGSVYSGLGLLDVMDYVSPDIVTINTGLAASMGAVILCAGTKGKRKALKRSRTMIHQPLGFGGWMQQASDMEIEAKEINSLKKELYEIISDRTSQPYDRVSKDGDRDYWMTATDAKKYGMIDEIIQNNKK